MLRSFASCIMGIGLASAVQIEADKCASVNVPEADLNLTYKFQYKYY